MDMEGSRGHWIRHVECKTSKRATRWCATVFVVLRCMCMNELIKLVVTKFPNYLYFYIVIVVYHYLLSKIKINDKLFISSSNKIVIIIVYGLCDFLIII